VPESTQHSRSGQDESGSGLDATEVVRASAQVRTPQPVPPQQPIPQPIPRRSFLTGAGGAIVGAALLSQIPLRSAAASALAGKAATSSGPTGAWKDQVIMTIELNKYAGPEAAGDLDGTNDATSDEIQRFQYSLDETSNQGNNQAGTGSYLGYGLFGGDLVGFDNQVSHLKDFGITTVVIYPVVQVDKMDFFGYLPTNYAATDFETIDANFRGAGRAATDFTAYSQLISDLHDTSIGGYSVNVLQDMGMSLIGLEHPWFNPQEASSNIASFRLWDANTYSNNVASQQNSGPTSFGDALLFDISATSNVKAFSHSDDMTTANFDGSGNSYPAEASGFSISGPVGYSNYLSFMLGVKLKGVNNATAGSASSNVVFNLSPTGTMGGITVALAAVGAAASVTFRVKYSDGSQTDTVATIPTWTETNGSVTDPQTQGATLVQLTSFPTMNAPSGSTSTTTYIYGLSLAIDPIKTATCVTLLGSPGAAATRVLAISGLPVVMPMRLQLPYNERGFTPETSPNGNLNNSGLLFPIRPVANSPYPRYLTTTLSATWPSSDEPQNTRFAVGPLAGTASNVLQATGQQLTVTQSTYHRFRIAAFATGSDQTATFSINYSDGSSDTATITVKAMTDTPASSDIVVHQADHVLREQSGKWVADTTVQPVIFGYELTGNATKETTSLTLPDNANVHIAAVNPLVLIDNNYGFAVMDPTNGMASDTGTYAYYQSVLALWLQQGGADGFRIDSAQNYDPSYFKTLINDWFGPTYPGLWMLGEAAVAEPSAEDPNQEPLPWQLDSWDYTNPSAGVNFTGIYDFGLADALRNCFGTGKPALTGQFSLISQSIYWDSQFEQPWNQLAFFDVYENFPFLWIAKNSTYAENLPLLRLAAAFVFTINRIPMLFSGNEYLLIYGASAPPGDLARRPGYLFSSDVTGNSTYQDNYAYMQTLLSMRLGSDALRSEETLTSSSWVLQADTTFGFVRQGNGGIVLALFNNQESSASSVTVNLPSGVSGNQGVYNYILANADGSYGGNDSDVSWNSATQVQISQMGPYEAKIIQVS
jgi:VCBS repeat-containing protein